MLDEQQTFNAPYTLDWDGRVLRFSGVTQNVKAECVAACKLTAMRENDEYMALRFADDKPETAAKRRDCMERFEATIRSGRYAWNGDLMSEWRDKTGDGTAVFIGALLKAGGTPLTPEEVESLCRDKREEIAIILVLIKWDSANPKAPRPAPIRKLAERLIELTLLTSTPPSSKTPSDASLATSVS